jgi:hypothetical protein
MTNECELSDMPLGHLKVVSCEVTAHIICQFFCFELSIFFLMCKCSLSILNSSLLLKLLQLSSIQQCMTFLVFDFEAGSCYVDQSGQSLLCSPVWHSIHNPPV